MATIGAKRVVQLGILIALGSVVPFVLAMGTCMPARSAAKSFIAALRANDDAGAQRLAGAEIQALLGNASPDSASEDGRTIALLRNSTDTTFSGSSGGFDENCFSGSMDLPTGSRDLWVLVHKEGGAWKVTGLRSEHEPSECDTD
jgi:hypothetical protein